MKALHVVTASCIIILCLFTIANIVMEMAARRSILNDYTEIENTEIEASAIDDDEEEYFSNLPAAVVLNQPKVVLVEGLVEGQGSDGPWVESEVGTGEGKSVYLSAKLFIRNEEVGVVLLSFDDGSLLVTTDMADGGTLVRKLESNGMVQVEFIND